MQFKILYDFHTKQISSAITKIQNQRDFNWFWWTIFLNSGPDSLTVQKILFQAMHLFKQPLIQFVAMVLSLSRLSLCFEAKQKSHVVIWLNMAVIRQFCGFHQSGSHQTVVWLSSVRQSSDSYVAVIIQAVIWSAGTKLVSSHQECSSSL